MDNPLLEIANFEISKNAFNDRFKELIDQLACLHIISKSTRYNIKQSFLRCCDDKKIHGNLNVYQQQTHDLYEELM